MKTMLQEIRRTLVLAVPIIIGQVAVHSLHLVDTAMIGRVGVTEVAAAAYAGSLFGLPLMFGFGLCTALTILVAQAFGARNLQGAKRVLRQGLVLSLLYGLLAFGLVVATQPLWFHRLGQPPDVAAAASPYFALLMAAMPTILIYQTLKHFCEAQDRPWLPLLWLMGAVVLNVLLNWVLIFGKLGFPALGLVGAGWATFIARLVSLLGFWWYLARRTNLLPGPWGLRTWKLQPQLVRQYLWIGIPIGFQIAFEVSAFNFAAIMMGWIGTTSLAAHQIAINLAAFTFMLPLGLSFAVSIRVGQAVGARDWARARTSGLSNFALAATFMALMGVGFLLGRHFLPTLFLGAHVADAGAVIALAATFLVVAALFQVGDGIQIVATGALRGLKDIRVPTALVFFAFWVVSLPLGFFLAFEIPFGGRTLGAGLGGMGIWLGLAIGICVNAGILTLRFHLICRPDKNLH